MAIFNYQLKLSYYSAPKCACTTLKHVFFEIENGFSFKPFSANGKRYYIHSLYPSQPFGLASRLDKANHHKIAVVRDPIDRLLSCYRNRVVHHRELCSEMLSAQALREGLVPDPSLAKFIDCFDLYRAHSHPIAHHSEPLVYFLGERPEYFSKIYKVNDVNGELVKDLMTVFGVQLTPEYRQTGGPTLSRYDLLPAQVAKIQRFYEQDYATFHRYF